MRNTLALSLCEDVTKKRQSSYTVEYKLGLLRWYQDNGENATARHFGIDRKRLREWLEKEDKPAETELNVGKEPLSLELDKAVLRFLEERVAASP